MDVNQQEVSALERHVGDQASSPLFAKLASLYLESGRAQDALRICDAGLANFPFYSTGHLIKGKALQSLGLHGEARREFEFVHTWLPTNPTVINLLRSVPQSDDQVLEAPPADHPPLTAPENIADGLMPSAEPAGGFESSEASETAPAEVPAAGESTNMFGLPAEAPDTSGVSAEEAPATEFGGMEAFAQFDGVGSDEGAPAIEETFEAYAERKRTELGPPSALSVEDYLMSPPVEAAGPAEPDMSAMSGGEDAFAAAGFGMGEESPAASDTVAEEAPPAFGGFGEQDSSEDHPQELAGFGEQSSDELPQDVAESGEAEVVGEQPPAFGGFGEEASTTEQPQELAGFGPEEATEGEPSTDDPSATDDFGFSGLTAESSTEETPAAAPAEEPSTEAPASEFFSAFVGPGEETAQQETAEQAEESAEPEAATFPDFSGIPAADEPASAEEAAEEVSEPPVEEGGFSGPPMEEPAAPKAGGDRIGELAEKLQDAKKITPVIDLTTQVTSSTPSSADEAAADAGFVTPTLAEIYAKQGWFDDAINAYRTLGKTRPAEKDKFEHRIKELEEEKAKAE